MLLSTIQDLDSVQAQPKQQQLDAVEIWDQPVAWYHICPLVCIVWMLSVAGHSAATLWQVKETLLSALYHDGEQMCLTTV